MDEYVDLGPEKLLGPFFAEYRLSESDLQDRIRFRWNPLIRGREVSIHRSLLRSHDDEFPCAGDAEAVAFCREVVAEMVRRYGLSSQDAAARLNRLWSGPDERGRVPRTWIAGTNILYHEAPQFWAEVVHTQIGPT